MQRALGTLQFKEKQGDGGKAEELSDQEKKEKGSQFRPF